MKTKLYILFFFLLFVVTVFSACSSSKILYLYDKKIHKNAKPAIFEIASGVDRTGKTSWQKTETAFGYEAFAPLNAIHTWISKIDSVSVNHFIRQGKSPSEIKSYRILPGKHKLEIGVAASGPYESLFTLKSENSTVNVSSRSYYRLELTQPISITVDVEPAKHYTIETVIRPEVCEIAVYGWTVWEKNNNVIVSGQKQLVIKATQEYRIKTK